MNKELKLLISLAIDYLRWTQLTPMLLTWGFALLMLAMLIFVNFQEQVVSALEYFIQWLMQLPLLGKYFTAIFSNEDTTVHLGIDDLKTFALRAWIVISLVFMLAHMAVSALFGPFEPWSLKRKLVYAGAGSVLLLLGLVLNYFSGVQNFNGGASGWMLQFSLLSLGVFLVSTYSLSVSHALGRLNEALSDPDGTQVS